MSRPALCTTLAGLALSLATAAQAGGPTLIRTTGAPFAWANAGAISYRTDNGPLSASVNESAARARVEGMFGVWQAVPTATISYSRVDFINATGAFSDGDVSTVAEYNAVLASCNAATQSPVIYDVDATIFVDLGFDQDAVIGFAGPCAINTTQFLSGQVVMNGLFQDGLNAPVPDITPGQFDAAIVHEIGHFSGLDHSQINVNCLSGCGNADLTGLPTMFPFLLHESQVALSTDDIAWISRLYPAATFATTHGTITGRVFFSDGDSQAQLVNVIARRVDTGGNEDRTTAVSVASGYKFRSSHGNPISSPTGDSFGTQVPGDIGLFEIPVPAGNYTIEVESIDAAFTDGSSIGAPVRIAMPGTAPAPSGPIAVAAGATVSGNDVTLIGTPPRFDPFEGP